MAVDGPSGTDGPGEELSMRLLTSSLLSFASRSLPPLLSFLLSRLVTQHSRAAFLHVSLLLLLLGSSRQH